MAPENSTSEVTIDVSEDGSPQQTTEDESGTTTVEETPLTIHTVWFKTLPGQLMSVQVVFSLLAFVSIISGYKTHSYWFFILVAIFSSLWALCVVIVHLFQFYRRFSEIPWMPVELIVSLAFILMWFVADMVMLSRLSLANTGAALMCGIFAFLTYCASGYLGAMSYLDQVRRQGTPMPSAAKAADRADGGGGGDSDSNSEDSLSEMPTVYHIGP
ncbi:uncharacterized protein [Apostichopus japonicus]|uniref:uncharacterized protein n=1 Tax=Stichopus japonicus TaxID=307972 RepID=UPI003AB22FD1